MACLFGLVLLFCFGLVCYVLFSFSIVNEVSVLLFALKLQKQIAYIQGSIISFWPSASRTYFKIISLNQKKKLLRFLYLPALP